MGCLCSKIGVCFLCDYALTKPWGSLHFWHVGKPSMKVVCMFVILKNLRPMQEKVNAKSDFEPKWEEPKPSSR